MGVFIVCHEHSGIEKVFYTMAAADKYIDNSKDKPFLYVVRMNVEEANEETDYYPC